MTDTTHEARDLLPCPFCGGQAEVAQQGTTRQSHVIACTRCGCLCESGETGGMRGNHWNTRAEAQAMVAAALRDAAAIIGVKVGHGGDVHRCGCGACVARRDDHAAILALITPDAQAALDRMLAAERERGAKVADSAWMNGASISEIAAAIRKGGE